jgi:DNA-binding GntR family transcriptional regulator
MSQDRPAEVRKTSRMQVAYSEILRRIATLELAPGTTFTEGQLAEQLGLSKTPVREALLLIGADGLVYPQISSGYRVSQLTLKGARDLFQHWQLLSGSAARLAAENGLGSNEFSTFSELAEGRIRFYDPTVTTDDETPFHLAVAMAARNEELVLDTRRLHLKLQRLFALGRLGGAVLVHPQREHTEILKAVQRGRPADAADLVATHIEQIEKTVMDALLSSDALQSVNLA